MFTLKKRQRDAFAADARDDFDARLAGHVERVLPERAAALGAGLRVELAAAVARAEALGFADERSIVAYVDAELVAETRLDDDAAPAWARAILGDDALRLGAAERLLDEALASR